MTAATKGFDLATTLSRWPTDRGEARGGPDFWETIDRRRISAGAWSQSSRDADWTSWEVHPAATRSSCCSRAVGLVLDQPGGHTRCGATRRFPRRRRGVWHTANVFGRAKRSTHRWAGTTPPAEAKNGRARWAQAHQVQIASMTSHWPRRRAAASRARRSQSIARYQIHKRGVSQAGCASGSFAAGRVPAANQFFRGQEDGTKVNGCPVERDGRERDHNRAMRAVAPSSFRPRRDENTPSPGVSPRVKRPISLDATEAAQVFRLSRSAGGGDPTVVAIRSVRRCCAGSASLLPRALARDRGGGVVGAPAVSLHPRSSRARPRTPRSS
jgi:hypothetical protein